MKRKIGIPASLLLLTLLLQINTIARPQDPPDKPNKGDAPKTEDRTHNSTASIQIKFSAENKAELPSGSRIQWNGEDSSCKQTKGGQPIGAGGMTSLEVPVCKINILIFITGFNIKTVALDLPKNSERFKDTIHITVRRQGEPEVDWKRSP